MKSFLALMALIATMSLCNLTDKSKQSNNANRSDTGTTEPQREPQNANAAAASESQEDRAELTVELMKIEYVITTASYAGDISTLADYVADDYSGTTVDGETQNKNQLLASTKPDKITRSWKITDGEIVSSDANSAVLAYTQHQILKDGRTFRARVTDTFVKRNGRWLVKSEQATLVR